MGDYGAIRPQVVALVGTGVSDAIIARRVGCSRQYVGTVRAELGGSRRAPNPGRAAAREVHVPDGQADAVVELNGGWLTIEPAAGGRALLTLHERRCTSAIVRVNRAQLTAVIEALTPARDALPEVDDGPTDAEMDRGGDE